MVEKKNRIRYFCRHRKKNNPDVIFFFVCRLEKMIFSFISVFPRFFLKVKKIFSYSDYLPKKVTDVESLFFIPWKSFLFLFHENLLFLFFPFLPFFAFFAKLRRCQKSGKREERRRKRKRKRKKRERKRERKGRGGK